MGDIDTRNYAKKAATQQTGLGNQGLDFNSAAITPGTLGKEEGLLNEITQLLRTGSLDAIRNSLHEKWPKAHLQLSPQGCFASRKGLTGKDGEDADLFFACMARALEQSPLLPSGRYMRMFDFNLPNQRLVDVAAQNIVNERTPEFIRNKFYHSLIPGRLREEQFLTDKEREKYLFEPFANALAAGNLFYVDHHYPYPVLSTVCTTVLIMDFLEYLRKTGREKLICQLQDSFAVMDHADCDMLLAHFALLHCEDKSTLQKYGTIIRNTALFNDYAELRGSEVGQRQAKILYFMLTSIEKQLLSGECTCESALKDTERALELASRWGAKHSADDLFVLLTSKNKSGAALQKHPAEENQFARYFTEGIASYRQDQKVLEEMASRYDPAGSAIKPGILTKIGPVLFIYVGDNSPEVQNVSALMHYKEHHPELLDDVQMIGTCSPAGAPNGGTRARTIKMRSFIRPDGTFLDLSCVIKNLNEHERFGKRYKAGGRGMATGLSKTPLSGLDVTQAAKDIATAAEMSLSK